MTTDRDLAQCWRRDFPAPSGNVDVWILPEHPNEGSVRARTAGLPAMVEPAQGPVRSATWIVPVRIDDNSSAVRITRIEPVMEPRSLLRYLCARSFDSAHALVRSGYFHEHPPLLHLAIRADAVSGALIALLGVETEPVAHVPWGLDLRWPGAPSEMLVSTCAALRRVPDVVRSDAGLRAFVAAVDALVALVPVEDGPRLIP